MAGWQCIWRQSAWLSAQLVKWTNFQIPKKSSLQSFSLKEFQLPHSFGYAPLWQQYKHFSEILRLYHYDNNFKFLPKSLHMKVYKNLFPSAPWVCRGAGNARGTQLQWELRKGANRLPPSHLTSPVFAVNLNFSKVSCSFVIITQSAHRVGPEPS